MKTKTKMKVITILDAHGQRVDLDMQRIGDLYNKLSDLYGRPSKVIPYEDVSFSNQADALLRPSPSGLELMYEVEIGNE